MAISLLVLAGWPCLGGANGKAPPARQVEYEFHVIDPEGHGEAYIDAHGINNARQVVVDWSPDGAALHAALWQGGQWTPLDYVDPNHTDTGTYLTSLNERGQAFGVFWTGSIDGMIVDYQPAAFIDVSKGTWTCLPEIPDFPYSQGVSMNNAGRAVGWAGNDAGETVNWIWSGSKYLFPTYPEGWDVSGFWAGAEFINDAGQIGGQYVDVATGRTCGFFQDGSRLTSFEAPGNPDGTYVNGITDSGDVLLLGAYSDPASPYYPSRCFLWRTGVFTALPNVPFPNAAWTSVFGINERGDICGPWQDTDGLWHAFVAFRK